MRKKRKLQIFYYMYSIICFFKKGRKKGPIYRHKYVLKDTYQNVKLIISGSGGDTEPKDERFNFSLPMYL